VTLPAGQAVLCTVEDGVGLITLNNPERRNALTLAVREGIVACFDELEARDDVGAVVLTGAGSAFCAGADLGDLSTAGAPELRAIYDGFLRVARSPIPTIAAVNGPAVGAGMNLALACDVRVAGRAARFVARFLQLGLHPGGGAAWMLSRAAGAHTAAAMLLFGEELDGEGAARVGLAWRCVDDDKLIAEALLIAARTATVPRNLSQRMQETLRETVRLDALDDAVALETDAQVWSIQQESFRERLEQARAGAKS
jgi:enoyl-CoA hydratase